MISLSKMNWPFKKEEIFDVWIFEQFSIVKHRFLENRAHRSTVKHGVFENLDHFSMVKHEVLEKRKS